MTDSLVPKEFITFSFPMDYHQIGFLISRRARRSGEREVVTLSCVTPQLCGKSHTWGEDKLWLRGRHILASGLFR